MVSNKKNPSPGKIKKIIKKPSPVKQVRPSTMGSTTKTETNMKVIVRVRPPNERESQENFREIVNVLDDQMLIFDPKGEENPFFYRGVAVKGRDLLKKQNKELEFIFDRVFNGLASNEDIFKDSTKNMISSLLDGYNCSVFAYGATGAGKTHTMLGKENEPGITYLTMVELFNEIAKLNDEREFNLGVTYLEIYNENVQDLLHKTGPLQLRDDGRNGVVVTGMKIIRIDSPDELFNLLTKGNKNRTQFATDANGESSRSHAVFQVYISMTNKLTGQIKCVKLSMIDLAGSERASATGCKGDRFKEGANINKSLLALGNCINNLADGIKHIPYRDSKLTRLLKDSLGGNCQTVMIANIAPSSLTYEDTYNTLRYANRAKKIKTNVKKNIVSCQMHVAGYIKIIEELKKENAALKLAALEANGAKTTRGISPDENQVNKKLVDEYLEKLKNAWARKKTLHEKILSLESSDKVYLCRMGHKSAANSRLKHLIKITNPISNDTRNASGKWRLKKSYDHFKRQREKIYPQVKSAWDDLVKVEEEIKQLNSQIKEKNLTGPLAMAQAYVKSDLEKVWFQQQFEHVQKISNLTQCDRGYLGSCIEDVCKTLQEYYYLLYSQGMVSENMRMEFNKMVKSLEGTRSLKWIDSTMTKEEEAYYNMTHLSLKPLKDPLNSEAIGLINFDIDEFGTEPEIQVTNQTSPNSSMTTTTTEDSPPSDTEEPRQLNDTFTSRHGMELTQQKIGTKRVLSDISKGGSPAKQVKKANSSTSNKVEIPEKENKTASQTSMMSAKSRAILEKLKSDRQKLQKNEPQRPPVKKSSFKSTTLITKTIMNPKRTQVTLGAKTGVKSNNT